MTERPDWRGVVLTIAIAVSVAPSLAGQNQTPVNRALATRADLENALAVSQGTGPRLTARDRATIEQRLREGDFQVGDRLVMTVKGTGAEALSDTFAVRAGRVLVLPEMAPLSLNGVLRSELQETLVAHVGRYIRSPDLTAEALLRIGILGAVTRPGYYSVRADQPFGDLLGVAGGPGLDADLSKVSILRDGKEHWPRDEVRRAMASGQSLDVFGLKGGDEFMIGRRGAGFAPTLGIVASIITLTTTIVILAK